jgi:hypothetical protein
MWRRSETTHTEKRRLFAYHVCTPFLHYDHHFKDSAVAILSLKQLGKILASVRGKKREIAIAIALLRQSTHV